MADAAQGALANLYVETGAGARTYQASGEVYEFLAENITANQAPLDTGGIRGDRSMPFERTRLGVRSVNGSITFNPSPLDLDAWLPRILGTAESTNTFALGDTFNKFGIAIDRVTKIHEYTDCLVTRATFSGQPGGLVTMTLDIIGGDENQDKSLGASTPSLGVASGDQPFVFHDMSGTGITLNGSAAGREIFDIEITIDNAMDARFVNAVTTTSITATDRIITLGITVPYDAAHSDLYRPTTRGLAGTVVMTNSQTSLATTFAFASLDGPRVSPTVTGKQEIGLRLDYVSRTSASTKELIVTNVSA